MLLIFSSFYRSSRSSFRFQRRRYKKDIQERRSYASQTVHAISTLLQAEVEERILLGERRSYWSVRMNAKGVIKGFVITLASFQARSKVGGLQEASAANSFAARHREEVRGTFGCYCW